MRLGFLAAGSVAFAVACAPADEGGPGAAGGKGEACPAGTEAARDADGARCVPILPPDECAPGTTPLLGEATCKEVGWRACPEGFAPDPSGWGCADVLPAEPCEGATMELLGESACQPIGDCAAAFPPADATHFVDASFADGELDATHFRKIADALAVASAGAVVAVADGSYAENFALAAEVTVVGRCPDKVTIAGASASIPVASVSSKGVLRGVTVTGGRPGIKVSPGGALTLEDVLLEGNAEEGIRIIGGDATVTHSVVRGAKPASPGAQTLGILVYAGGHLVVSRSAFTSNVEAGIGMIDAGTETVIDASVVRDTQPQPDGEGGMGVKAFDGSHVTITGSALVRNRSINLLVGGPGTVGTVSGTIVRDTVMDGFEGGLAWAVSAQKGATLTIEDSGLVNNPVIGLSASEGGTVVGTRLTIRGGKGIGFHGLGFGVTVAEAGSVELHDAALVSNEGAATAVTGAGSRLLIEDSRLHATLGTEAQGSWPAGRGGSAVVAAEGAVVDLGRSALTSSVEVAIGAVDAGTVVTLNEVLVADTQPNAGALYGHGLMVKGGASAVASASYFRKSSGIALAFAGATGSIDASFVEGNVVGIQIQDGSVLREGDPVASPPGALEVVVSPSTAFWQNETRVGTGVVALPDPVADTPQ